VEKGKLIEFRLQGKRLLAVTERPEGKKDWIVVDQWGQSHKLRPQRVEYEIGGGPYEQTDITSFIQAVEPYVDPSSLEVAWELLESEQECVTPEEMALLLFSDSSPPLSYAAHSLLAEDKIYFKKKGDRYEPRSSNQVEEIKHQLEVQQQREQEKTEFLTKIDRALAGEPVPWETADRTRLEALEKFVLYPEQANRSAQDILALLGRSKIPQAARLLLIDLGWWSKHENLFFAPQFLSRKYSAKGP